MIIFAMPMPPEAVSDPASACIAIPLELVLAGVIIVGAITTGDLGEALFGLLQPASQQDRLEVLSGLSRSSPSSFEVAVGADKAPLALFRS